LKRKVLFLLLRIGVSLGLITILFKFIPYQDVSALFKRSLKTYFIIAFLVFFLIHLIAILRWQFILAASGIVLKFREVFYTYFSGLFFNLFFPSVLAGDMFRASMLGMHHCNSIKAISSVVMDRFSGAVGLGVITLIAVLSGYKFIFSSEILLAVVLFLALIVFAILFVFSRRIFAFLNRLFRKTFLKDKIASLHKELYFFRKKPKLFLKTIVYSIWIQSGTCLVFYLTAKALAVDISVFYFFIVAPIILFISLLPITVAGMGTREMATIYFLSQVGVNKAASLGISLAMFFFMIMFSIIGGLIYVTIYHRWLESSTQNTPNKE
jgi:hypothetical protein